MGAHWVKINGAEYESTFKTARNYHFFHSIALLFVSKSLRPNVRKISRSGILFSAGIVLFCGSLYFCSIKGDKSLGKLAPIGGLCFIVGWICL
eukprot:UN03186